MKNIFQFGEKHKKYDIRVLNEREARAASGILFLLAFISFMHAWFIGDFEFIKYFIILFFSDFFIRVIINPKYSPSLIIGRFIVRKQIPEYTGAPQKRFAWGIGLVLSSIMFYFVVLNNLGGPITLFTCLFCLTLMFFETAFGICIGCKIYNLIHKKKAQLCPAGVCEIHKKEPIQYITIPQVVIVILFILFAIILTMHFPSIGKSTTEITAKSDCQVPDWAIKIGHEEKYKRHHKCQ